MRLTHVTNSTVFCTDNRYNLGKVSRRHESPTHLCFHNNVLSPSPSLRCTPPSNQLLSESPKHIFHRFCHQGEAKEVLHSESGANRSEYLAQITLDHRLSFSWISHQRHFPNRAVLNFSRSLMPSPPHSLGRQTWAQLIQQILLSSLEPSHKNFHMRPEIVWATALGNL